MEIAKRSRHCGLVVNYKCNAACRHCLYACTPGRTDDYMTAEATERICSQLTKRGIKSLHIGGGEPFLHFEGLLKVVEVVINAGIDIEYIETNGFWSIDEKRALQYLAELKLAGADNFLISIDPFHIEFVPLDRPLRLAKLCDSVGFKYFFHQKQFVERLSALDTSKVYSRKELEEEISPEYLQEITGVYNVNPTGSAINLLEEFLPYKPVSEVLQKSHPCKYLINTDFIHIDLYEMYLMSLCSGIALPLKDAVEGIAKGRFPVFEALLSGGIRGLLDLAEGHGYEQEQSGYVSSCAMCFHIRRWLCESCDYVELDKEYHRFAYNPASNVPQ